MADASDIETALVSLIVGALYPIGIGSPSVVGQTCSVERGWPTEADIRNATAAETQLIRVHALEGMGSDSERYFRMAETTAGHAPTLTVSLAEPVITFAGSVTSGLIVAVLALGNAYSYTTLSGDTLGSVAIAVAALIPSAVASGARVTLPNHGPLPQASVRSAGTSTLEVGRERQVFNISVWATTPALRDTIIKAINPAFAETYRLTLPDGSIATRVLKSIQFSGPNDMPSRAQVWRRDVRLTWDYPIIQSQSAAPAAIGVTTVTPEGQTTPFVTRYQ